MEWPSLSPVQQRAAQLLDMGPEEFSAPFSQAPRCFREQQASFGAGPRSGLSLNAHARMATPSVGTLSAG